MKKSLLMTQPRRARWTALSLALVTGFAALLLTSCKKGGADAKPADVDYYTCTMHPSVRKQSPSDKCPICSMDLTPVKKKDAAGSAGASDVDYYYTSRLPGEPVGGIADVHTHPQEPRSIRLVLSTG